MPASGDKGSFVQGYNCQAVVDATAQIIIAADVTQAPNDKPHAQPLLQQAIANTDQGPKIASLDAGYFSEDNVHALTAWGYPSGSAAARTDTPGGPAWPDPHGALGR